MEELKTKLEQLYKRVEGLKENIATEEATKMAFIVPFLQILGYDVFNPTEVVPEYIADIGTKKGEKIDYTILKEGSPIIIIECKHWKEKADAHNSQLHRYFHNTNARFGIMTNGIIYNFFTDLEKPNIMDEKPFMTIDLSNLKDSSVRELVKFQKQVFDLDSILSSAEVLKYIKAIKQEFEKEIQQPSDEFIRLIFKRFFSGQITANRLDIFREYTQKAITSYINELINTRLKSALNISQEKEEAPTQTEEIIEVETPEIVTTDEELEGFYIIKAILREKLPANRIACRDTKSYFGVLLDDNSRKPICRLHFNGSNKYIELFHNGKDNSERVLLSELEEIYDYKEQLLKTIDNY